MLKDLKWPDMPAVLAIIILSLFGFSCVFNMVKTGTLDADFKQTLFAITMVSVGFYLGSSSDSRKKTDAMIVSGTTPAPPVSTTTTVTDAATVTKTEPAA